MNDKQAKAIVDSTTAHFKMLGYNEDDITAALVCVHLVTSMLTDPYMYRTLTLGNVVVTENPLPFTNKMFPEILRAVANVMEAKIELENKGNENRTDK